jgi:hypothetical protein
VLNTAIITGEFEERKLPSGATEFISLVHSPVPQAEQDAVIERVRELMAG